MLKYGIGLLLICMCGGCETRRDIEFKGQMAQPPAAPHAIAPGAIAFDGAIENTSYYCVELTQYHRRFVLITPPRITGPTPRQTAYNDFADAYLIPEAAELNEFIHSSPDIRERMAGVVRLSGSLTEQFSEQLGNPHSISFKLEGDGIQLSGRFKWSDRLELNEQIAGVLFTWPEAAMK